MNQQLHHEENDEGEIYVFGEIYNLAEITAHSTLLDLCINQQEQAFRLCKGDWFVAYKNKKTHQVYFVRNKMGTIPCYYYQEGPRIFVSDRVEFIFDNSQYQFNPDPRGLLDMMYLGYNPCPDLHATCFASIRSVPPSHALTNQQENWSLIKFFDFSVNETLNGKNPDEYAREFRRLYLQALNRRAKKQKLVAVSVSGGLDSSAIYCGLQALHQQKKLPTPPLGLSYTSEKWQQSSEVEYLNDIEKLYPGKIKLFKIEDHLGFQQFAQEQIHALEIPNLDYIWGITKKIYSEAKAQGATVLMTGHWGDQFLFPYHYTLDFIPQGKVKLFLRHLFTFKKWFNPSEGNHYVKYIFREAIKICLPDGLVHFIRSLKKRILPSDKKSIFDPLIEKTKKEAAHNNKYFHYQTSHKNLDLLNVLRSKYHVQCMEWNYKAGQSFGLKIAFPMLDEDLFQFLLSIPSEYICHQGVPRFLLRQGLTGILPKSIQERNWKADFTDPVNYNLQQDLAHIKDRLGANALIRQQNFVNTEELQKKIDRLNLVTEDDCMNSWELADILALELWLQQYEERFSHEKIFRAEKTNNLQQTSP